MNGAPWSWPPPYLALPFGPTSLQSCGSILTRVTAGPTQIVPAAPPGFFNVLSAMRFTNESVAATADVTLQDPDGIVFAAQGTAVIPARGAGTDPLAASSVPLSSALPMISAGAITCTVNSGGPVLVQGYRMLLPILGITFAPIVLTAAFQSVPLIPTASGVANVLLGSAGSYGLLPASIGGTGSVLMNNDTAATALVYRHTRGATVSVFTTGTAVAARTRGGLFTNMGPFIAGDVCEIKDLVAPAVAGSQVARFYFLAVPLVS